MSIPVPTVHLSVGIGRNDTGGFSLAVEILAVFKDIDQVMADELVKEAHSDKVPVL